jgi:hypothetical protein
MTTQNRFDTENELLDYKVKDLEVKVKDLTEVGAKEINEENKVLKNKIGDALEEVEAQKAEVSKNQT